MTDDKRASDGVAGGSTPADLLRELLDRCTAGEVTQADAARLLCLRKADIGALVGWEEFDHLAHTLARSVLATAFRNCFPWTDWRLAVANRQPPALLTDDLWRPGPPAPVRIIIREPAHAEPASLKK